MAYVILWTHTAANDLKNIVQYISSDNPEAARSIAEKIISKIDGSALFPNIARVVPEIGKDSIREIIISPYRLILELNNQQEIIRVLRIWHASRGSPRI